MDARLVEEITRLVVSKLNEEKQNQSNKLESNQTSSLENIRPITTTEKVESRKSLIQLTPMTANKSVQNQPAKKVNRSVKEEVDETLDAKLAMINEMKSKTPSRIGVGRAGNRPRTEDWIKFRFDHAAAVDAVYGEVSSELLDRLNVFSVNTKVSDKNEYIRRPDLGRRLSDEAKQTIEAKCKKTPTVQIVISNGLSAHAVETNVENVYLSLQQSLTNLGIEMGTSFYVDKGRVALMDDIGDVLTPDVVIMLIGERPGLISAESLSAYLCYKPRKGVIEADRMVISNIHQRGMPPVEAGAYIGSVIQKVLKYEASGVSLVKKEG